MQTQRVVFTLCSFLLLPLIVFTQQIEGIVLDKRTGLALQGASIEIEGLPIEIMVGKVSEG